MAQGKNRKAITGTECVLAVAAGKFILFTVYYDVLRGAGAQAMRERRPQPNTGASGRAEDVRQERRRRRKKVTAHAAAKRVPAPANTVPLSELVNTFCK